MLNFVPGFAAPRRVGLERPYRQNSPLRFACRRPSLLSVAQACEEKELSRATLFETLVRAIWEKDTGRAISATETMLQSRNPRLPSVRETNKLLTLLGCNKGRHVDLAKRTLRAMPLRSVVSYATVLRAMALSLERPRGTDLESRRQRLVDEASSLFHVDMMARDKLLPDTVVCNSLLLVYANAGAWQRADGFFRSMPTLHTTASFNTLLKAYSRAAKDGAPALAQAFDLVDEMYKSPTTWPTVVTFSTLIGLCGKRNDVQAALEAFQFMLDSDIQPNTRVYSSMVHVCGTAGLLSEARAFLETMPEPDVYCFTAMINAFGKEHKLEEAFEIFALMGRRGIKPNVHTFSALIDAVAKSGDLDLAFHLFGSMARFDVEPNEVTYGSLLSAVARHCRYSQHDDLDRAFQLFQSAKEAGKLPESRGPYADLLGALGRSGDLNKAVKVFKEYRRDGRGEDDEQMHTLLIDAAGRSGRELPMVWEVFEDMRRRNLEPSEATFRALMMACCAAGDLLRACMVFSEMKRRGLPLDTAYNMLLHGSAKAGDSEAALSVFNGMQKAGVSPSLQSYASLLSVLSVGEKKRSNNGPDTTSASDNLFRVFLLFSEMNANGIAPNRVAYNNLLHACAKARDVDHAFQVYRAMKENHIYPDIVTYSSLVQACSSAKQIERALEVVQDMRAAGCQPGESIYLVLLRGLCRRGKIDRAVGLLREARQDSIAISPKMYSELIRGCQRVGDFTRAESLRRHAESNQTDVAQD